MSFAHDARPATFQVLGPVRVHQRGPGPLPAPAKIRLLLAVLVVSTNRVVPNHALVEELWGENPPPTAPDALRVHVSTLRRHLPPRSGPWLLTEPAGYRLDAPDDETDVHRFEKLLAAGQRALVDGDFDRAAAGLRGALDLWRGPALADVDTGPLLTPAAARLDELRTTAQRHHVDALLRAGHPEQAVAELRPAVADRPLDEAFHAQLLLALYRCGRQAEALNTYRDLRVRLSLMLRTGPSRSLRHLHTSVLRGDPHLDLPAGTASDGDAPAASPRPARHASTP